MKDVVKRVQQLYKVRHGSLWKSRFIEDLDQYLAQERCLVIVTEDLFLMGQYLSENIFFVSCYAGSIKKGLQMIPSEIEYLKFRRSIKNPAVGEKQISVATFKKCSSKH